MKLVIPFSEEHFHVSAIVTPTSYGDALVCCSVHGTVNTPGTGAVLLIFIYPGPGTEPEFEKVHVMLGERDGQWLKHNDGSSSGTLTVERQLLNGGSSSGMLSIPSFSVSLRIE